ADIVGAVGLAGLAVVVVRPRVALLGPLHDAVAARRRLAVVGARVEGIVVAVVARLDAGLRDAVATDRGRAGVGARVGLDVVAVVAIFAGLLDRVAAQRAVAVAIAISVAVTVSVALAVTVAVAVVVRRFLSVGGRSVAPGVSSRSKGRA